MKYQKKGSGAFIIVGDATIKASDASRNLMLKNLEKQFEFLSRGTFLGG